MSALIELNELLSSRTLKWGGTNFDKHLFGLAKLGFIICKTNFVISYCNRYFCLSRD